jgi:methionine sulfoxide reductase catalytic subunit
LKKEKNPIHYPADRRAFIAIKPYMAIICGLLFSLPIGVAWLQYIFSGLPADPGSIIPVATPADPVGFPMWLNLSHWVNFFFLIMIIRPCTIAFRVGRV